MNETSQQFECVHVQQKTMGASTLVQHSSIQGGPSRVTDLRTETRLCPICSGLMVQFLRGLENPAS